MLRLGGDEAVAHEKVDEDEAAVGLELAGLECGDCLGDSLELGQSGQQKRLVASLWTTYLEGLDLVVVGPGEDVLCRVARGQGQVVDVP